MKERIGKFDFVIIGAGRGGTSLLAGMLDAHTKLEVAFEKFSYDFLMAQNMGDLEDTLENRINAFEDKSSQLAAKSSKIWANKITTEQICALDEKTPGKGVSSFVEQVLKGRKTIFILRDGRTCVKSKMTRTGQDYNTALKRWKDAVALWQRLESLENTFSIKFEDLVKNPRENAAELCSFLDVPFDLKMLNGTANSKMRKEYQRKSFDKTPLELTKEMIGWQKDMEEELITCNYPLLSSKP